MRRRSASSPYFPNLRVGNPGNSGGKKGRSGRRPKHLSTFLRELREDPDYHETLRAAALDADSKGFGAILRAVAEYDLEKPANRTEVTGAAGGPVEVRVRIVREGARK